MGVALGFPVESYRLLEQSIEVPARKMVKAGKALDKKDRAEAKAAAKSLKSRVRLCLFVFVFFLCFCCCFLVFRV